MLLLSLVLEWVYALNVTTCKIIVIIICFTMGVHAERDRSQHSCCHYVLFYSEYIIMLNVPGHAIYGVIISCFTVDVWAECKTSHHSYVTPFMVSLSRLSFFFYRTKISSTGTKISCTSSPVYEGETASVTCHFNSNLRETKNNFFVYRTFRMDGKRRHGNTLHTDLFSTCKTILKISTMPVYS